MVYFCRFFFKKLLNISTDDKIKQCTERKTHAKLIKENITKRNSQASGLWMSNTQHACDETFVHVCINTRKNKTQNITSKAGSISRKYEKIKIKSQQSNSYNLCKGLQKRVE